MLITVATLHVGERDLAVMERAAWMSNGDAICHSRADSNWKQSDEESPEQK